jgi:hypothetical protein
MRQSQGIPYMPGLSSWKSTYAFFLRWAFVWYLGGYWFYIEIAERYSLTQLKVLTRVIVESDKNIARLEQFLSTTMYHLRSFRSVTAVLRASSKISTSHYVFVDGRVAQEGQRKRGISS